MARNLTSEAPASKGLTLDSGALIALEKRSLLMTEIVRTAHLAQAKITVPIVVIAQIYRSRNVLLDRLLRGSDIEPFGGLVAAMNIGRLLGQSQTTDVVDAAVVLGAAGRGDTIITSDPKDIARLLAANMTPENRCPIVAV